MKTKALAGVLFTFAACRGEGAGIFYSRTLPVLMPGVLTSGSITAVTIDPAGNTYLTGSTENARFPVTPGAYQTTFGGGTCTAPTYNPLLTPTTYPCDDAFVVKLDPKGNIVFATYLGGSGLDRATSLALDPAGNVYVAGITIPSSSTAANNFPILGGPFGSGATGVDFIAKLNPTGAKLLYSTLITGAAGKPSLAGDAQGNVYFSTTAAGYGPSFPSTSGALHSSGNLIVGKLNSSGSQLLYGAQFGGRGGLADEDSVESVTIDSSGNAYVTGITDSPDFPTTPGAFQTTFLSRNFTSFVAKLNSTGSALVYATFLGGSLLDEGSEIRVDAMGNTYILGSTQSSDFPVTTKFNPSGSNFIAKLNPQGTALIYSTLTAAVTFDIDPSGNAYVAGQAGPGIPTTQGVYRSCLAGGPNDVFVAQISPRGELTSATYFGGSGSESGSAIAAVPGGSVVLAGVTDSADLPVTQGPEPALSTTFVASFRISNPSEPESPCIALALQNGASFEQGPIAPGELVTLRGLRFGPDIGAEGAPDSTGNLAPQLAGVQVFFDDLAAPLLCVQSQQINAQVPFELAGKSTTHLRVDYNGASTQTITVPVATSAPAIFYAFYNSTQGSIVNENGTLNTASNPAKAGSAVAAFGTGGGLFMGAIRTGAVVPLKPLSMLTQQANITLDERFPAQVLYAGAAPEQLSGIFQINFRIPENLASGTHTVDVTVGPNYSDANMTVTIAVQ